MATLSTEIKTFVVKGLARYDTPSELVRSVRAKFGVEITRQQVHAYDPACAKPPAPRWRELHAATRAAFLNDIAGIGVAQKAFRLRALDRLVHYSLEHHYRSQAAAFLAQAAKECGGIYERVGRRLPATPEPAEAAPSPERGASERASVPSDHRLPTPREQSQLGQAADEGRQCRQDRRGDRRGHDDVVEAEAGAMGIAGARAYADRGDVQAHEVEETVGERKRHLLSTVAAVNHADAIARCAAVDGVIRDGRPCRIATEGRAT
jgi:hypothetical protein